MTYKFAAITEHDKFTDIVRQETFELKNCPFCDGLPIFICPGDCNDNVITRGIIFCSDCKTGQTVIEDAKVCVEKWNKRIYTQEDKE